MHKTSLISAIVLAALATSAYEIEKKFQPYVDYDGDGCYNTAAIDPNGKVNHSHDSTGTPGSHCHNPPLLYKSNTYSRRRCNNGYCAVMYEYYFEKDQAVSGSFLGGYKDDWENVVFAKGNAVVHVAPRAVAVTLVPLTMPRSAAPPTQCSDDIANPENDSGHFYESLLVGWNLWPSLELKNKMLSAFTGGISPKLDSEFGDTLKNAAGDNVPRFDPYLAA
ncbi:hypothetical protein VE04_09029 [Pseudogymnoascus sp. 24MN13]|nr:hypothetical protein VE04_09029 [Pseudogymnoascus sp. 24MN13]